MSVRKTLSLKLKHLLRHYLSNQQLFRLLEASNLWNNIEKICSFKKVKKSIKLFLAIYLLAEGRFEFEFKDLFSLKLSIIVTIIINSPTWFARRGIIFAFQYLLFNFGCMFWGVVILSKVLFRGNFGVQFLVSSVFNLRGALNTVTFNCSLKPHPNKKLYLIWTVVFMNDKYLFKI